MKNYLKYDRGTNKISLVPLRFPIEHKVTHWVGSTTLYSFFAEIHGCSLIC